MTHRRYYGLIVRAATALGVPLLLTACNGVDATGRARLAEFIQNHVAQLEPLETEANLAYWEAATTGTSESYGRHKDLQLRIRQLYQNPRDFAYLQRLRAAGGIEDPRLARQLELLYIAYLRNQIPLELIRQIVERDNKIQEVYNNFRGTIEGEPVTNSDIYRILTTESDSHKRQLAWRASKQVGGAIASDLIVLVKLRNQAARRLGFADFHAFSLATGEQDAAELDRIFDQLDEATREPFARYKQELDAVLAKNYAVAPEELWPWHYHDPFFQRTPLIEELDLDTYYRRCDVKEVARSFYAGIGLPVDDILARSDLYDRQGKYPHAFSYTADRKGDVRILCNLNNDERWMETILHELGHAVYSKYHDRTEPFLLREPAHSFTTEAVAMFFGRLSRNAAWMRRMLSLSETDYAAVRGVGGTYTRGQQVLFVRWTLVMYHFERQLYADPDQDLNSLWWELVERYQLVRRPSGAVDAGWASKLHFVVAPCYYHNYMLGELLASQMHHTLQERLREAPAASRDSYTGDERIGQWFQKEIFAPGTLYRWDELIERATGEPLTPRYFVQQFIQ
ncbi:MAG: M2 family metallopeptidase [Sedimentisphaerales bacterium]|nr:M2 family metallopeptidase [Sedimentisphaerales bacterium]